MSRDHEHDEEITSTTDDTEYEKRDDEKETSDVVKPQPQPKTALVIPEELTENLREFLDLCDTMKKAKEALKDLNERKMELELIITGFMVENKIPAFKTSSGKVSVGETKSQKPLSKEFLQQTISTRILDVDVAKELTELAFSKRPTTTVQKIKVTPKRANNA